jgi:molecular chaperone GrpE
MDEHEIPVKVVDRRRWNPDGSVHPGAEPPLRKPTYVEELERQLAEKDRIVQEELANYRKASADFEQARARMRKELAKDAERSRREVLISLLEVVDNLDRAIEAARSTGGAPQAAEPGSGAEPRFINDALLQGVELVRQQFLSKLEGFNVFRVPSQGAVFDPALHEAVSTVPPSDSAPDGHVAGVVRHGYRIGDEVLRPALVAVAKAGTGA